MIKNIRKKGRVRQLPDLSQQTSLQRTEPSEKIKYKIELSVTGSAESSFIFSLDFLRYADVYRRESGKCRTLPFFLTFFIISPFQVFLLYLYKWMTYLSVKSDSIAKMYCKLPHIHEYLLIGKSLIQGKHFSKGSSHELNGRECGRRYKLAIAHV